MGQKQSVVTDIPVHHICEELDIHEYNSPQYEEAKVYSKQFNGDYLKLPFLKDKLTVDYVNVSKVMFIMRGLPGSGRPLVVKHIKSVFEDPVVCSTSEYFMHSGR